MTNLDSILKNRNITLPTKVCLFKRYTANGNFGIECYVGNYFKNRKSNASFGFPFYTCEVLAQEEKLITAI